MIKGVNRQIIEVMDTGNPYFERALLVVRPGYTDTEPTRLREEAQRMLRKAGGYAGLKRQRRPPSTAWRPAAWGRWRGRCCRCSAGKAGRSPPAGGGTPPAFGRTAA